MLEKRIGFFASCPLPFPALGSGGFSELDATGISCSGNWNLVLESETSDFELKRTRPLLTGCGRSAAGECVLVCPALRGRSIDGSRTFIFGLVLRLTSLRLCPALLCAGARLLLLVLAEGVGGDVLESSSSSINGNGTVGEATPAGWRKSSRSEGADCVAAEIVLSVSGDADKDTREMFGDVTVGGEAAVSGLLFAVVLPL